MLIYLKISGWIFYGLILGGFFFIGSKINFQNQNNEGVDSRHSQEPLQLEENEKRLLS